MAKRRDQMVAMAKHRQDGAEIAVLQYVREFAVHIGDIRELRDSKGRVCKIVRLLECRCRITGRQEPIEKQIEMEAADNWGPTGEIEYSILPAVQDFCKFVGQTAVKAAKDKDHPLGDGPRPLPSDQEEQPAAMTVRNQNLTAARAAAKAARDEAAKAGEAAPAMEKEVALA